MKNNLKENLIVIEKRRFQWMSSNMSTNCPSPLSMMWIKDRASRNIVGGRELLPDKLMEQFLTFLSFLIILSSIMIVISINPIHSIFWLVLIFINSSGFLIGLNFNFIPLMLIIIYVGAITIIFLFVVMMMDIIQIQKIGNPINMIPIILIFSVNIIIEIWWLLNKIDLNFYILSRNKEWEFEWLNQINNLGTILYTEFGLPFIILSLLLLVGMIGAIILTLELSLITKRQVLSNQHQRNNSWI